MRRVGDLGRAELVRLLRSPGLTFTCGTFIARVSSKVPGVANGLHDHYGGHPLAADDDIVDSRVGVRFMRRLKPWRPRRIFADVDGAEPFVPMLASQAIPMLETALNFAFVTRSHQYLILHAAVLARDNRALVLVGASGSGKSTLAAALAFEGWRLLSDELTLIRPEAGTVSPLPRPISLKNQSIDLIAARYPHAAIGARYHGTLKGTIAYARPPAESLALAQRPAMPAWLVFPKYGADTPPALHPLPAGLAFTRAIGQSPNYLRLGEVGFRSLTAFVDRVPAYHMVYDSLDGALGLVNAVVERAP